MIVSNTKKKIITQGYAGNGWRTTFSFEASGGKTPPKKKEKKIGAPPFPEVTSQSRKGGIWGEGISEEGGEKGRSNVYYCRPKWRDAEKTPAFKKVSEGESR